MLNFIIDLTQKAGEIIISEKKRLVVEKKSRREIVTNADIAVQKFINNSILENYPNHTILGEESYDKEKDYSQSSDLWLVDPIDGTTNFAQGLTDYGVSIAYYHNLEPLVGVIFFPEKNMLFTAEVGKKAKLNGSQIKVSNKKDIKDAVLGSLYSYNMEENMVIFDLMKKIYPQIKTMRFLGSAVLDISYTAAGFLDGTFGYSLKPWDMAAGALIVKEAGGVVTTLRGDKWHVFQPEILVSNPALHPHLVHMFTQILP